MKLTVKKLNLLFIPIVERYYDLQEVLIFYYSLYSIKEQRDFYPIISEKIKLFLNIENVGENIEALDYYIFSHNQKIEESTIELSEIKIRMLHPIGFDLLNLDMPFDYTALKKAYLVAAKKHHPDVGGNENDMKALNDALPIYQDFLSWKQYSKSEKIRDKYFKINDGKSFYTDLFVLLLTIDIDFWELDKAYEVITYLFDSDFFHFALSRKSFPYRSKFFQQINTLSKKMTAVNKYDIADKLLKKSLYYKEKYQYSGLEYDYEATEDIIAGKKKYKIVITHILQADNAYKINIITEKKYKGYIQKFAEIEFKKELLKKKLEEYLIDNIFIKLPFDKKIKYASPEQYIPHLGIFDSKIIYETSIQQQNEYYFTFYLNPTLALTQKYIFVRILSYVLSIRSYEDRLSYLPTIMSECYFFDKLYENENEIYGAKSRQKHIKMLITDLQILTSLNEADYKLRYQEIEEKYLSLLGWIKGLSDFSDTNKINLKVYLE